MEASAPKRRKMSPSTSVSVEDPGDASTPSGDRAAAVGRRRPSFASPTRASLARAYPDLVGQRSRRPSQQPAASDTNGASEAASERNVLSGARSPVRRAEGTGMDARPRRSPTKPSPRPLPPPSDAEEELLDPFRGRVLRRSPPPGVLPARESQEPELPPTPAEKGLAAPAPASTSPLGIHRTPTKRPRRSRFLAERMKSSPLKEPPVRPAQPPLRPPAAAKLGLAKFAPPVPRIPPATRPPLGQTDDTETVSRFHPARGVVVPGSLAEKERLRSDLAAEVARLEADLDMAAKENDRVYADAFNAKAVSPVSSDPNGLIDLLLRHQTSAPPEPDSDDGEDWLEAAMNPIGFLRFGFPSLTLPLPSSKTVNANEKAPAPIKSHHPVPLTAAEEMPFLQLFSPLVFTSTVALHSRTPEDEDPRRPMQKHAIVATSKPAGLFTATIEMTVDTKALAVTELSVPRLDPSSVAELGAFIQSITGGAANSALKSNVSVITWAMAEWTRLATQRARFWCRLQKELGTEKDLLRCASRLRERVQRRGAIGRQRANDDSDDDSDAETGRNTVADPPKTDLVPYMGRTNMDLRLGAAGGICLRVEWRITFDWTGEGQSHTCVLVEAPAKCRSSPHHLFSRILREALLTCELTVLGRAPPRHQTLPDRHPRGIQ